MPTGFTYARTIDGMLDEISRLRADKADALDLLIDFQRTYPEHDTTPQLLEARLCLL